MKYFHVIKIFAQVAPPQYSPSKYPGRHMVKARRPSQQLNNHGQVEFFVLKTLKMILCRTLLASSLSLQPPHPPEGIRSTPATQEGLLPQVVWMADPTGGTEAEVMF